MVLRERIKTTLKQMHLTSLGQEKLEAEVNAAGLYEFKQTEKEKVFIGTVGVIRDITKRRAMERELIASYQLLEKRVEARTKELADANARLLCEVEIREQAEKDIKESEQLLQAILDGMGAAVFYVDPSKYIIKSANRVGLSMLKMAEEDVVGKRCCDLICPGKHFSPGRHCHIYMEKILNKEGQLELDDGRIIPVIKHVLPFDIKGRKYHVEILFDQTERKSLERQLAYAQKLEAVGQLAAGIAHEVNTPIQYIGSNIDYIQGVVKDIFQFLSTHEKLLDEVRSGRKTEETIQRLDNFLSNNNLDEMTGEVNEALSDSLEGVNRISTIVRAMKRFSHPDIDSKKPVDVNAAIMNTLTVARNEWKYHSKVETSLAPKLPTIFCAPGDFNQLMLNLIVNAAHANTEKYTNGTEMGRLHIQTSTDGERVIVEVEDSGIGIEAQNMDRVFDPFFTTKEVGKGTGQGLAIVHAIVDKHGGEITFTSERGVGTKFMVSLPIGEDSCP